jgi:hypothetical protein
MKIAAGHGLIVKSSLSNFSGIMWLAMAVVIGVAVNITMKLEEDRRLPPDFDNLEGQIRSNQKMVDELNAVAILPPLSNSWRAANAAIHFTGVELTPIDNAANIDVGNTYAGPLKNWKGALIGKPIEVISLVKSIQKEVPLFLYDYSVAGGTMKLNFVVVGS